MACATNPNAIINANNIPKTCADDTTLKTIFDTGFIIIGAVCVLVVVIGGFRYIRAGSNDTIIAESKRQIAHALVGLIVTASAATIVNFALKRAG